MDSPCQGHELLPPCPTIPWTRFQTLSCLSQAVQEDGQGSDGNGGEKSLCCLQCLGKPQRNHTAVLKELCRVRASPKPLQAKQSARCVEIGPLCQDVQSCRQGLGWGWLEAVVGEEEGATA